MTTALLIIDVQRALCSGEYQCHDIHRVIDTINGEKATRILLVPKDPEILARVKKCELWISDKGWTVQQKFHTGGGDYVLSTYSRMNINPNIADKELKLDLPKGVKFGKLK